MKRNKTMVGGLRFSCYVCAGVCFSRAFNVCFSRQGRAETCAHNRDRENVSDQFPSRPLLLFFPVPIDNHEPVQPAAKCGTSTRDELIERLAAFPYFISRQGSRSRIFIADRVETRVGFSRALRIFTTTSSDTYISRVLFPFSYTYKCWNRRRTIERPTTRSLVQPERSPRRLKE